MHFSLASCKIAGGKIGMANKNNISLPIYIADSNVGSIFILTNANYVDILTICILFLLHNRSSMEARIGFKLSASLTLLLFFYKISWSERLRAP